MTGLRKGRISMRHQGRFLETAQRFCRNRLAVTGLVILIALIIVALFASIIAITAVI